MGLHLPAFSLRDTKGKYPFSHALIARRILINKHGVKIAVQIIRNRPGTMWWAAATYEAHSMRASNTLRTTSEEKARRWVEAVNEKDVTIGGVRIEE